MHVLEPGWFTTGTSVFDLLLTEFLCNCLQLALSTRNEDNVQLLGRQLESEFLANTITGSSDDYFIKMNTLDGSASKQINGRGFSKSRLLHTSPAASSCAVLLDLCCATTRTLSPVSKKVHWGPLDLYRTTLARVLNTNVDS